MALALKILGTQDSYFMMLYELIKMNVLFHLSLGMAKILSVGLSDQHNSFLKTIFPYLQWLKSYSC